MGEPVMDFEHVLEKCGGWGRFQLVLLLLFGYTNVLSSLHYFSQTLITFTPDHWCNHQDFHNLSTSDIRKIYERTNLTDTSCTLLDDFALQNGTVKHVNIAKVGQCSDWVFEREDGYESVTSELNWVCHNRGKSAFGQSLFFFGSVTGTVFFGFLSDKIGRLPAMLMTTLTGATGDFITSFTQNLTWFSIARFMSGLSTDTLYYLMFILVFEYLSPKHRTFGLNIVLTVFYCIGLISSPWLALYVGSWRRYLWFASLPALGALIYPIFICESAQWLITKKKYERAVRCLKHVAAFNGRQVDEHVYEEFINYSKEKCAAEEKLRLHKDTFLGMFRTPRLRIFTIVLFLKSMIITISYDIVARNVEGLGTSPFLLFSISGMTYIPAGLTIIIFQNHIGRKGMACTSLFIGAIITGITGFLIAVLDPKENAALLAAMVMLGRYGATVSYDSECQYAAELIPTSVRGRGLSNIHVAGYAFSFFSPYIIYLGTYYKPIPSIFITVIMLSGAALCLLLPETQNKALPQTLAEGERFALNEKWHYFECFKPKNDKELEARASTVAAATATVATVATAASQA